MTRVFVYGTLKSGHHRNGIYLSGSKFVGQATIDGFELYSIRGAFPAVVRPADGQLGGLVYGEVYEVDDGTLRALDRLEQNGTMYTREIVETSAGPAYVYIMSREEIDESRRFGIVISRIGESWEQEHYRLIPV
jgi:gamma-glutamylcyclotransferase (GGCT)/AIG2-like uncharacterized protein YtfP